MASRSATVLKSVRMVSFVVLNGGRARGGGEARRIARMSA
jgi:hypothetical protein